MSEHDDLFDGDLGEVDLSEASPSERSVRSALSGSFLVGIFSDLFDGEELRHLTREGAFAFVDALTVGLVADGLPEDEELNEFRTQIERLPFSIEDIEQIHERAESDVTRLAGFDDEELAVFLAEIATKIDGATLRERAIKMAASVTYADYAVTGEEARILGLMAAAFGVSSERVGEILAEVREAAEHGILS